jgi:hypothetical protein
METESSDLKATRLTVMRDLVERSFCSVHERHHAHQKIQPNAVVGLKPWRQRLGADARHMRLSVRLVGERVVQIVRELPMDADRLQPVEDGIAGAF